MSPFQAIKPETMHKLHTKYATRRAIHLEDSVAATHRRAYPGLEREDDPHQNRLRHPQRPYQPYPGHSHYLRHYAMNSTLFSIVPTGQIKMRTCERLQKKMVRRIAPFHLTTTSERIFLMLARDVSFCCSMFYRSIYSGQS